MSGNDPYLVGYNDGWYQSGMRHISMTTSLEYVHQYNTGYTAGVTARREQDWLFGKLKQGWLFSD